LLHAWAKVSSELSISIIRKRKIIYEEDTFMSPSSAVEKHGTRCD
jgi:hypothetical protein